MEPIVVDQCAVPYPKYPAVGHSPAPPPAPPHGTCVVHRSHLQAATGCLFLTKNPLKFLSIRLHSKCHKKVLIVRIYLPAGTGFRGVPVTKNTLYFLPRPTRPTQRQRTAQCPLLVFQMDNAAAQLYFHILDLQF